VALVWDLENRFYEKTIQIILENARIAQNNKESGTTATSIASAAQVKPAAAAKTPQNNVDAETVFLEYMKALNFKSGRRRLHRLWARRKDAEGWRIGMGKLL
jgi:hypothetical protein